MEIIIHDPDGAVRPCPGPDRSGHCALQLGAGLALGRDRVPCAGRRVTATVLGCPSEWRVSTSATRCFIPELGLMLRTAPGSGVAIPASAP